MRLRDASPAAVMAADPEVAGKRLLVLGAGLWQVEYLRRARELGVETWATDWSADAEGRGEAAHFEPIDLKDRESTLALARRARVHGVLTAADIGVPTAAYVAGQLQLPGADEELAERATHKRRMREHARTVGLNVPWFVPFTSPTEARSHLPASALPVIVKPVDNCSSRGVRYVDDWDDLEPAIAAALEASRAGEALVEEFISGTEGSIEAFVQGGVVTILGFCDKTKSPLPHRYDLELRYPGAYDARVAGDLVRFTERLSRGFEVDNGILHIEFVVSNGRVFLIEFALRGCGSKVITHLIPPLTGVDVVHALIRQALGLRTDLAITRQEHGVLHFLMFPPGLVRAVHGVAEAKAIPGVIDVCVERGPGDIIDEVRDGRSRPGHVLLHAASRAEVQARLAAVRSVVRLEYGDRSIVGPVEFV